MSETALHTFHENRGARFTRVNGVELVAHYGEPIAEYRTLRESVGVIDLSARSRLCLTGMDRVRFLNGQVTNDVKRLTVGNGCYAALVSAKGKMISDVNVYALAEELLLDFEPGLTAKVVGRLEKYIIADDVQIVDASPHYHLWSVQGPGSMATLIEMGLNPPANPGQIINLQSAEWGELYCANQGREGQMSFTVFVPIGSFAAFAELLSTAAAKHRGGLCGWDALELVRIEDGIPRFGADMDDTTLPPEAGLEVRAVSYEKGCYIGQEIIARIRTYGQVARKLCGLRMLTDESSPPAPGDALIHDDKAVGSITSAAVSPTLNSAIALGYVRRECNQPDTELIVRTASGDRPARLIPLPLVRGATI